MKSGLYPEGNVAPSKTSRPAVFNLPTNPSSKAIDTLLFPASVSFKNPNTFSDTLLISLMFVTGVAALLRAILLLIADSNADILLSLRKNPAVVNSSCNCTRLSNHSAAASVLILPGGLPGVGILCIWSFPVCIYWLIYVFSAASTSAVCAPFVLNASMINLFSSGLSLIVSSKSWIKLVFKNKFSNDSGPFAPSNISGAIENTPKDSLIVDSLSPCFFNIPANFSLCAVM